MTTFKNILIILGAFLIPIVVMVVGFSCFHAEQRVALAGYALLIPLTALFAFKRSFAAMGLYLAATLVLMVVYPKLEGLESYGREGKMLGQLAELRMRLEELKSAQGAYPASAEGLPAKPLDILNGHPETAAVETRPLPPEAYLHAPAPLGKGFLSVVVRPRGGREYRGGWSEDRRTPVLLYPGGTYDYEVREDRALISSGTISVPLPAAFPVDGGTYAYDPAVGHVFINCTHPRRQHDEAWWTF